VRPRSFHEIEKEEEQQQQQQPPPKQRRGACERSLVYGVWVAVFLVCGRRVPAWVAMPVRVFLGLL
jgi:hypothetical protein